METLRQIAEDALLLAANIREGEYLDETGDTPEDREHSRSFRIAELVISIGERIVDAAGIPHDAVWTPTAVRDLLDGDYGEQ